ncbi:unnamed protein product, partial [Cyprideis torosa]
TGTFGRVYLVREKGARNYYALKQLRIKDVLRMKQVDHVMNEKKVLQKVHHPFIIDLMTTWHDNSALYLLFEYVSGGELFSYLRSSGRFPSST